MRQRGGVCRTDRRRHSCRWEGDQTKKNRRPDRPKRLREGVSGGGGGGVACIGERKKRQILGIKRWQIGGTGAGQRALSDSAPNWRGTALQYPTKDKKVKPKKKKHTDRGIKKVLWRGVGVGNSKKKTTDRQVVVIFKPIMYLSFPSFQRTPYHSTKKFLTIDFLTWRKKQNGYYGRY
jgi:hypothetical protein